MNADDPISAHPDRSMGHEIENRAMNPMSSEEARGSTAETQRRGGDPAPSSAPEIMDGPKPERWTPCQAENAAAADAGAAGLRACRLGARPDS
jgi:hypothetical protein